MTSDLGSLTTPVVAGGYAYAMSRAVPSSGGTRHRRVPPSSTAGPRAGEPLAVFAIRTSPGMKDEAIARVMGLSRRTIQKHITDIGAALGARTGFRIALSAQER
ncbi:hypothetical protein [Actinoallomurus sp. CA-142502]|uniref:hypothetical protein n=1 Tax=Actinoallomurus sp. CA-142502 TaxID=3239885 RepID=UPI003D9470CD